MIIIFSKNGVFLKNQGYDQMFAKIGSRLSENTPTFLLIFFGENVLKIITSVPETNLLRRKTLSLTSRVELQSVPMKMSLSKRPRST
jgi:hypothetical protein